MEIFHKGVEVTEDSIKQASFATLLQLKRDLAYYVVTVGGEFEGSRSYYLYQLTIIEIKLRQGINRINIEAEERRKKALEQYLKAKKIS